MTLNVRAWLVVGHSLIAVPLWAWVYVAKGLWIWAAFTIVHAVILGFALGVLAHPRLSPAPPAPGCSHLWSAWSSHSATRILLSGGGTRPAEPGWSRHCLGCNLLETS